MDIFLVIFLSSILAVAAWVDLRLQKIPNLLTYPTMGIALVYHLVINSLDGLLFSAGGLVIGIGVLILPYIMGGMGAGDAKLMAAAGAVLGPRGVFGAFLLTAVIGGGYALILIVTTRQYFKGLITRYATTLKTYALTRQLILVPADENEEKPKLCYGVAIALGTLSYMFLELSGYNFLGTIGI